MGCRELIWLGTVSCLLTSFPVTSGNQIGEYSTAVNSCTGALGSCSTSLAINMSISDWTYPLAAQAVLPAGYYNDSYKNTWYLQQSITVTLSGDSTDTFDAVGFPLTYSGTQQNTYVSQAPGCTGSWICCQDNMSYWLASNATIFNTFRVEKGVATFPLVLEVSQQSTLSIISVDAYGMGASSPGLSVSASISRSPAIETQLPAMVLLVPNDPAGQDEGFLVPAALISPDANSIGISSSAWQACFKCSDPIACVTVQNGSAYDQFDQFQNYTIAAATSGNGIACSYMPSLTSLSVSTDAGTASQEVIACTSEQQMLQVRTLGLVAVGNVSNIGGNAVYFGLEVAQCCNFQNSSISCVAQNTSGVGAVIAPGSAIELSSGEIIGMDYGSAGGCNIALMIQQFIQQYVYAAFPTSGLGGLSSPLGVAAPEVALSGNTTGLTQFIVSFPALPLQMLTSASSFKALEVSLCGRIAAAAGVPSSQVSVATLNTAMNAFTVGIVFLAPSGLEIASEFAQVLQQSGDLIIASDGYFVNLGPCLIQNVTALAVSSVAPVSAPAPPAASLSPLQGAQIPGSSSNSSGSVQDPDSSMVSIVGVALLISALTAPVILYYSARSYWMSPA